jgi:hypothetical protein
MLMPNQKSEKNDRQPNIKELITFSEASRLSGYSDRHLRKLASQKKLWVVKLGRNWFTTALAIKKYLDSEHKPGPKPKKADK